MKKIVYLLASALAVSALLLSCSKTSEMGEELHKEVILTTTLTKADNPATKAIAPDGKTSWAVGEKVQVRYTNTSSAYQYVQGEVTSVTATGGAVITATLIDPKEGDNYAYFRYPYSRYSGAKNINTDQVGTLADISENFDLSEGGASMTVSGGVATLPNGVTMTNYITIWHITFPASFAGYRISVSGGASYRVSPASATNEIYVAMRGVSSKDITIFAMDGSGNLYQKTSTGKTLAEQTLYNTTISDMGSPMATTTVAPASITSAHVGYILGADGKAYSHIMAAEFAGTTASGIIAYVGASGTTVDKSFTDYNVLVLNTSNITAYSWYFNNTGLTSTLSICSGTVINHSNMDDLRASNDGYADTQILGSDEHQDHRHSAAQLIKFLNGATPADSYYATYSMPAIARPTASSPWFLPSAGQWQKMVSAMIKAATGSEPADLTTTAQAELKQSVFASVFTNAGATALDNDIYFSSTEHTDSRYVWAYHADVGRFGYKHKQNTSGYIRAVFVYKPV